MKEKTMAELIEHKKKNIRSILTKTSVYDKIKQYKTYNIGGFCHEKNKVCCLFSHIYPRI